MKVKKNITAARVKGVRKMPAELPEELIRNEILIRLPIKYVARFKSVSKSWLSLLSDPEFVREHYTRSASGNPNEYDCLIAEKQFRIVILSRYNETLVLPTDKHYQLVGSINGIVCLRRCQKLSLWNPAIHQSKEVTIAPHHSGEINSIGFGFDPVSNDYKVVVSIDSRFASFYSSKFDSWTDLFVSPTLLPKSRDCDSFAPTTIVKNCPYWTTMVYRLTTPFIYFASLKFDAGSNEFKLLPNFYYGRNGARGKDFKFVNMKDCLALMVHERDSIDILVEVYSLDEEGCGVWNKMYNLGPFNIHESVLLSQGFKYGGEILCHVYGKLLCYDLKTGTIKHIQDTTGIRVVYGYTPSLLSLPGMESVYLQTQTRTHGLGSRTPRRLINSLRG